MEFLIDTNIIVHFIRESDLSKQIERDYFGYEHLDMFTSVVVHGELESLALQKKWGEAKLGVMGEYLNEILTIDINSEDIIWRYAEIDAFSQGKLSSRKSNFSARNMGKNDLWIAATASVLNIPLITIDNDFNHLQNVFLELIKV